MSAAGILLAMETSGSVCGMALTREGELLGECRFRHEMHLSERLMSETDWLLKSAGLTLAQVDAFAVGIGPGSFTGTRIGVMTMKTLASVQNKPIYGVDSLAAMAAHHSGLKKTLVIPVLSNRPGTVFAAIYDVSAHVPRALVTPAAFSWHDLAETIPTVLPPSLIFCGSGIATIPEELTPIFQQYSASFCDPHEPSPALIAWLADLRRASGEPSDDVLALAPLYIAPPPITQAKVPIPTEMPI